MVEGTQAQAAGRSIRELERLRDDSLVAIQQVLRRYDIGAGKTLRELEERLYTDARAAPADRGAASADVTAEPSQPLRLVETVVRPEWADYNTHMSDFRYYQLLGDAMDALYRRAGVDAAYRKSGRMFYTVETHITHVAEAMVGEPIDVTTRVLAVDEKRVRVFHRIQRRRDRATVATGEQMHLHVNTAAGKASLMDPTVRGKLEAICRAQAAVPPPAEAGRGIGQARP
jgi:carnitine 3-dehydrogenase